MHAEPELKTDFMMETMQILTWLGKNIILLSRILKITRARIDIVN